MKILTVGVSPYFIHGDGKIHSEVLKGLSENHEVVCACCGYDMVIFPKHEDGHFYYETEEKKICRILPFASTADKNSIHLYEIIKYVKPDVVLTIGDYNQIDFIQAIKILTKIPFKWISLYILDAAPINTERAQAFEFVDGAMSINSFGQRELSKYMKDVEFVPFGINLEDFKFVEKKNDKTLKVLSTGKNEITNCLLTLANAVYEVPNIECYIHSNYMDSGENILNSWNKGNVKISESYIGLNDGDSIKTLVSHYNIADVIVDISANSKTAISLLEGMACGCIPVGVVGGRAGEIISQMPCEFQFFVDSNEFYWTDNEVLQIPSKESLQKILVKLQNIKENDFERFVKISRISREIAEKYTTSKFIEGIERVLLKTPLREQSVLCVENLTNA